MKHIIVVVGVVNAINSLASLWFACVCVWMITNLIIVWLNLLYDDSMLIGPKQIDNEKNDC